MSRSESDREDLLREATALIERAELQLAEYEQPIVAGFRRDGSASFFFGADPVYQFNTDRELRRAYVRGLLVKAECGRLVSLRRERSEQETALVRHDLNPAESEALLADALERLRELLAACEANGVQMLRQIPEKGDVVGRIIRWLHGLADKIAIASVPNVR
jgi:hypothetical protein